MAFAHALNSLSFVGYEDMGLDNLMQFCDKARLSAVSIVEPLGETIENLRFRFHEVLRSFLPPPLDSPPPRVTCQEVKGKGPAGSDLSSLFYLHCATVSRGGEVSKEAVVQVDCHQRWVRLARYRGVKGGDPFSRPGRVVEESRSGYEPQPVVIRHPAYGLRIDAPIGELATVSHSGAGIRHQTQRVRLYGIDTGCPVIIVYLRRRAENPPFVPNPRLPNVLVARGAIVFDFFVFGFRTNGLVGIVDSRVSGSGNEESAREEDGGSSLFSIRC